MVCLFGFHNNDAWVQMIAAARVASVPVIYTTPVSRADGADVVMLPTDPSAETGVPPLTNAVEGTAEPGFPDEISPRPEDYVFLKRRPSAFYGTGVVELLHMPMRPGSGIATSIGERETAVRSCRCKCSWKRLAAPFGEHERNRVAGEINRLTERLPCRADFCGSDRQSAPRLRPPVTGSTGPIPGRKMYSPPRILRRRLCPALRRMVVARLWLSPAEPTTS